MRRLFHVDIRHRNCLKSIGKGRASKEAQSAPYATVHSPPPASPLQIINAPTHLSYCSLFYYTLSRCLTYMDQKFSISSLLQAAVSVPASKTEIEEEKDSTSPAPTASICSEDSPQNSQEDDSPKNSPVQHSNPPYGSSPWYNAMNYVNLTQQLAAQMAQAVQPSISGQVPLLNAPPSLSNLWDPRLQWLYPYMGKSQQKRKGGQIRFTNEQTDALEHKFDAHKYLSPQERKKLAKSLSLSERQVIN
ncbi:unnamed protein product [Caenorhabditis auriculariae]|uniref:Homeobox domain-containing protein n=1 Tax=Caenorhabditis auriculariae TaxID=2777116 RepID=A0A8S1GRB6_9PELO|nr:unnamed protein product [Caenorhabditis auriculariae]